MNVDSLGGLPPRRGIVLAADVVSLEELRHLSELSTEFPQLLALKLGFLLALRHGLAEAVKVVRSVSTLPIIYDHQKAGTDIPQMGKPFASTCRDAGVDGIIVFGQAGPRTIEGFVSAARGCGLLTIVGLTMSHPQYLASEGGYIADDAPERVCRLALDLGCVNFVLPGNRTNIVANFAQGPLSKVLGATLFMPGIGSQGGSIEDAFVAARPHTPVAIIGSAIYGAAQPREAIAHFVERLSA
jgi:orotidine-5'-phosphate decarboxylase